MPSMFAGVMNTTLTHPADHRVELEYSRQIYFPSGALFHTVLRNCVVYQSWLRI